MIHVAILGFGVVGSGVAEVVAMNEKQLEQHLGQPIHVKRILDVRDFPESPFADLFTKNPDDVFEDDDISVVAETIGGASIAYDFTKRALAKGKSVVTSNKELVAKHDDQHGTAVVTLAGMINALRVVGKKLEDVSVVVNGAGAAATAITKLLISCGLQDVVLCDRTGAIWEGRENLNPFKAEMAAITNRKMKKGTLADLVVGADVFIGVSAPGALTEDMVRTMAKDAVIFACANPTPEIMPDIAIKAGAKVVGTGRSDFPNQVNNVLAFPGIFRGALDVRASDINDAMKLAAAYAIADLVAPEKLSPEYVIPDAFDPRVGKAVAAAVSEAARKSGVARI